MGFRKSFHAEFMPAEVTRILDPWGDYLAVRAGTKSNVHFVKSADIPYDGLSSCPAVNEEHVLAILQAGWEKATVEDARATIEVLLASSRLRDIGRGYYSVIRAERIQTPPVSPPPQVTPRGGRRAFRRQNKPGICPRCGWHAKNKNRHANADHSEECLLNKIRDIMES